MVKQVTLDRHWCSELVTVVLVNKRGVSEQLSGNLEEIGERTAVVLTDCPLPIASRVHIACREHVLRGITKTCELHRRLGYFIEVELAPASRWSQRWFSPRHLLALRDFRIRLSA